MIDLLVLLDAIWRDPKLGVIEKAMLAYMATRADAYGDIRVSHQEIAQALNITRRTVTFQVSSLRKKQWLQAGADDKPQRHSYRFPRARRVPRDPETGEPSMEELTRIQRRFEQHRVELGVGETREVLAALRAREAELTVKAENQHDSGQRKNTLQEIDTLGDTITKLEAFEQRYGSGDVRVKE